MKKNIIILGSDRSYTNFLSKLIVSNNKSLWFDGYRNKDVLKRVSNVLSPKTKYIIIEDVDIKTFDILDDLLRAEHLKSNRQYRAVEMVTKPLVILTIPLEVWYSISFQPSIQRRSIVINADTMTIPEILNVCRELNIVIQFKGNNSNNG